MTSPKNWYVGMPVGTVKARRWGRRGLGNYLADVSTQVFYKVIYLSEKCRKHTLYYFISIKFEIVQFKLTWIANFFLQQCFYICFFSYLNGKSHVGTIFTNITFFNIVNIIHYVPTTDVPANFNICVTSSCLYWRREKNFVRDNKKSCHKRTIYANNIKKDC